MKKKNARLQVEKVISLSLMWRYYIDRFMNGIASCCSNGRYHTHNTKTHTKNHCCHCIERSLTPLFAQNAANQFIKIALVLVANRMLSQRLVPKM